MDAYSAWARLLGPGPKEGQSRGEYFASRQPIRLLVMTDPDEFPDEFRDVLQVKVLGYREKVRIVDGYRIRLLAPIWTLVPKDA